MNYTIVLLADPDGGYTAVVPALPGCVSEGETVEEAVDMVTEAIELCVESAKEHGEEVAIEHEGTVVGAVESKSGRHWTKEVSTLAPSPSR